MPDLDLHLLHLLPLRLQLDVFVVVQLAELLNPETMATIKAYSSLGTPTPKTLQCSEVSGLRIGKAEAYSL